MTMVLITRETFELLAPVLYLSRFFCLQPLKFKKTEYNYVITKSLVYIAYSNITILLFVSTAVYGLSQLYKLDVIYLIRFEGNTERYVTFSDVAVVLIPNIISVVTISLKLDKYIKYYEYLQQFDSLLQKPPLKSRKYIFVALTTMFFTCSILIFDMVMWVNLGSHVESPHVLFTYFFPYYVCYSFTMVMELLYWQCVHSIKVRVQFLNEKISNAIGSQFDSLFMRIDRKKINLVVDTLKAEDLKKPHIHQITTTPDQARILITAYQKLTEATNSVNDCFGLIILIIILGCLIHLLVTPYSLYAIIFNTGDSMFIVSQSIWMTGHVLRLLLIVEPCHGCLVESRHTSAMVCKLLCVELEEDIKRSLEFFLAYLTQCRIEFTAFGLTKIHRGLLTTIAGAVTTYLVILFQFNKQ